jgi:hypothetical protein
MGIMTCVYPCRPKINVARLISIGNYSRDLIICTYLCIVYVKPNSCSCDSGKEYKGTDILFVRVTLLQQNSAAVVTKLDLSWVVCVRLENKFP